MLKYAPNHIKDFCFCDKKDETYQRLSKKFKSSYTSINKIRCICGNNSFHVYKDLHPTVLLNCSICDNAIVVYDLKYYPSANKTNNSFPFEHVTYMGISIFEVYAIYEYSEDFESNDDISWCYIYIKSDNNLIELINDETS